jgi:hypothetical protein
MSEMKLITERWNRFLIIENIEKLKTDPSVATDFLTKLSKISDKEELQKVLDVLLRDPEIKAATELVKGIEQEIDKAPESQQEGIADDFYLQAGQKAYSVASSPLFKKLVKYGGPLTAIGMGLTALLSQGTIDIQMLQGALDVARASTDANIENGIEIFTGMADVAAAGAKRDVEQ